MYESKFLRWRDLRRDRMIPGLRFHSLSVIGELIILVMFEVDTRADTCTRLHMFTSDGRCQTTGHILHKAFISLSCNITQGSCSCTAHLQQFLFYIERNRLNVLLWPILSVMGSALLLLLFIAVEVFSWTQVHMSPAWVVLH